MQLFPFSKVKLSPHSVHLETGDLKNSPAHTKHFWVRIGIPLCFRICWSSHSLCLPLWKPLRLDFWPLIEWAQSPGTLRCSSLCDLYNHCPLACPLSPTGYELPSIPRLVKPRLDPLPLTPVCLHLFVSCMPCLGDFSYHICCIVLSPSSCSPWKMYGDPTHKTVSFIVSVLKVVLHCQCHWTTLSLVPQCCALMEVLQPFPQLCEVRCRVKAFLYNKTLIPHC